MVIATEQNSGWASIAKKDENRYQLSRAGLMPWLPVWMSVGIGCWLSLPFQPVVLHHQVLWAVIGLLLAGTWFFNLRAVTARQWQLVGLAKLVVFALVGISLGFSLIALRSHHVAAPILGFRYYGPIEGRVIGIDRSGSDRMRVTLDRVVLYNLAPERMPAKVRLSLMAAEGQEVSLPVAGSRVMLTGHLGPPMGPSEPGGFDFRRFAWFERLGAVGYTRTPIMLVEAEDNVGRQWVTRLRLSLSEAIQDRIPGQAGAVAAAVTTGDRSGIASRTDDIMRDSNLYHIVSISGLHMSLLAGFLYTSLRFLFAVLQIGGVLASRPAHKLAASAALAGALGYMVLAGGGIATERAFLMVAVMLGAVLVDRRAVSLRTVALAAVILLAIMPEALPNAGFQMSFAATVALIVVNDYTKNLGKALPRWVRGVAFMALTSVVAGGVTGPIAAAQFNRITHYGLLANMAAVPVIGILVMPAAVIAALLAPLGLAQPALWVMGIGTEWMLWVAASVSGMSGSVSAVHKPPNMVLPMLGMAGVLLALTPWAKLPAILGRRQPVSGGITFFTALFLLASAIFQWVAVPRPVLLISSDGSAVGLMTASGRSPSKPSGGSFMVQSWLVSDGDLAPQADAALRPAWQGPRNERHLILPWGRPLYHLTGKGAEDRAITHCKDDAMIVLDRPALPEMTGCTVIDSIFLKGTGALAFDRKGIMIAADDLAGKRPWLARQ